VPVEFRLVVFRPFRGEIVQGVLLEGNADGIRVGLDFFSDVWIPAANLQEGSKLYAASAICGHGRQMLTYVKQL